ERVAALVTRTFAVLARASLSASALRAVVRGPCTGHEHERVQRSKRVKRNLLARRDFASVRGCPRYAARLVRSSAVCSAYSARKTSTTRGSNWLPLASRTILTAWRWVRPRRYARSVTIAS